MEDSPLKILHLLGNDVIGFSFHEEKIQLQKWWKQRVFLLDLGFHVKVSESENLTVGD